MSLIIRFFFCMQHPGYIEFTKKGCTVAHCIVTWPTMYKGREEDF